MFVYVCNAHCCAPLTLMHALATHESNHSFIYLKTRVHPYKTPRREKVRRVVVCVMHTVARPSAHMDGGTCRGHTYVPLVLRAHSFARSEISLDTKMY